jgi:hypothetical protein
MKKFYFLLLSTLLFISCEQFDENVVEISGIYQANVLGVSGPHTISVYYDYGDELLIEAPFDGFEWVTVYADVDNQEDFVKDIDIHNQEIWPGVYIWGDGFYNDGVLQLDYTIEFSPIEIYDFRMVAGQF